MSYTYLLEQEEESSVASFSDIPLSVLSRLNLTAEKSCSKGSGMESCQSSQSGMMSPHLTELRGGEKSMSSAEDFLAKTFQSQGVGLELKANEAGFGQKWPESLAKYDQNSRSWRTAQCLLFEDLTECLAIFPRWGMMHDGELWELTMSAHLTEENESGLLPDGVNFFHTPNTNGLDGGSNSRKALKKRQDMMWPSPRTRGLCGGTGHKEMLIQKIGKEEGVKIFNGGTLNPNWVEWLMGWPIGWTDLKPLEMDKFQQWLRSHSKFLEVGNEVA